MNYTILPEVLKEPNFFLFRHCDLFCVVWRMPRNGNLNGYVGVTESHSLYGKNYSDRVNADKTEVTFNGNYIGLLCEALGEPKEGVSIDLLFQVHGGITYSNDSLNCFDKNFFTEKLWWFGFDTTHAEDKPGYIYEGFPSIFGNQVYRNFEYVTKEVKSLAEQLSQFKLN